MISESDIIEALFRLFCPKEASGVS